ncbi:MAG: guanylate kinase [Pseudomonadota bacterium]|nr:guanylate kinase [Pseudomonadota bacterium]MEC7830613.1 guanylate kinase [Pseudomonadota bacterium]MEC9382581.1 guanylate kinase [Pseudomonadota bacterium]MEC9481337.1 guanylate kinase [Pseudomonadota bacterium]
MEIDNKKTNRKGLMFVLSSPSGAGKTSLSKKILELDDEIFLSVSYTTRPSRPGETDGKDYFFVDNKIFGDMRDNNEFIEYAKVFDYYYGTPRQPVNDKLIKGKDVLFDIDWQGTQQLMNQSKDDLVKVFVLPPSIEELERRLKERNQDNEGTIQKRMSRASDEMSHYAEYDYILVNEDFDKTIKKILSILQAERLKHHRQIKTQKIVKDLRSSL